MAEAARADEGYQSFSAFTLSRIGHVSSSFTGAALKKPEKLDGRWLNACGDLRGKHPATETNLGKPLFATTCPPCALPHIKTASTTKNALHME